MADLIFLFIFLSRGTAVRVNLLPQYHSHMEERVDVTVPMEKEMEEEIKQYLSYNDSKAGWIREAIRRRLDNQIKIDIKMSDELETAIKARASTSGMSQEEWLKNAFVEKLERESD